MPLPEIARRLGVSERTVHTDYKNAVQKLKRQPGAYSILLSVVHAVAVENEQQERDALQPGSVECRREFRALYAEGGDGK
jgi:DNA-directed RNA polymerase specialized sigma24 family protein